MGLEEHRKSNPVHSKRKFWQTVNSNLSMCLRYKNGDKRPTQLTVIQLIATPCHLLKKILSTKTSWKSWNSNKFCILGYYFFINCVKAQTINRGLKYLQWSFGNMYKSYATQLTAILSCLIHENRSIVFLYFSFYNPWAGVSYIPLAGYCILPMSKKASLNLFDLF
jgi:hypothetical protein